MVNNIVNFANELNDKQLEAVETTEGPVLILAGAGSGKTRALTYRVAYLVATGRATPNEILAVTFTNKSAKEMLERAQTLLARVQHQGAPSAPWQSSHMPYGHDRLWISTFHSSCVRILRSHIKVLDYDSAFVIYDDSDQTSVLKKVCEQLGINDKIYPPKTFKFHIDQAKNQFLSPADLKKRHRSFMDEKVAGVFEAYENEMRKSNALDFNDLLCKTVELFQKSPEVLEQYQDRFKYIMVDEYQDTNRVQYMLVNLLAKKYRNLCVVGDEDQSIYSWRGADISNILNFERDFPDAKVIKLEQNYRSTKNIVEAASVVIKNNSERKDKVLWTSNGDGSPITIRETMTEQDEARDVVREIQAIARDDNRQYNEFAIFYRTNAQSRVLEDQLRSHQIPYKIVGGMKFYDRAEIKDILSYLKVLANPKDNVSLKRIINTPARGIGKTTIEKLEMYADTKGLSIYDAIVPALSDKILDSGATRKVLDFAEKMAMLMEKRKEAGIRDLYHDILDVTQYVIKLKAQDTPEADARVENLEEFDAALTEFEKERGDEATLEAFLEEIALVTDADKHQVEAQNAVTMMTLHVSKGLEFPVVFIVGLEEGLFPSQRSMEETGADNCEEERRLMYVGMTRARQKLFLCHARTRKVWGQDQMYPPSRFLAEIPEKYVERNSRVQRPTFDGTASWRQAGAGAGGNWAKSRWDDEPAMSGEMPTYEDFADSAGGDGDELRKGMKVRHPSYGVGVIHGLEGYGEEQKVTILFPNKSLKKFIVKFARLERV